MPQAWGPFAEGKFGIFSNPVLSASARKHGKSIAQVVTRWLLERDIAAVDLRLEDRTTVRLTEGALERRNAAVEQRTKDLKKAAKRT